MHESPGQERYRLLLDSPQAHQRAAAAMEAGGAGAMDLLPRLREMMREDRAPFVITRAEALVAEVRFAALSAVEALYGNRGLTPDFGPVPVRKAMNAEEARQQSREAMSEQSPAQAADVRARVSAFIDARVKPLAQFREAIYAYCTLQELGHVSYRREEVDPQTYMTPTQEEIRRSQLQSPRPLPHVRVASRYDPSRTLGFVYRDDDGQWSLDFTEGFEAANAESRAIGALTMERKSLPRVKFRDSGEPIRSTDGSFVLDGSIDKKTGDPNELSRSLAAFIGRHFFAEAVTP